MSGRLFPTTGVLKEFLASDERLSLQLAEVGGEVTLRGREDLAGGRASQRVRSHTRIAQANDFLSSLAKICPWIELAGISGSTAYGGAKPEDDVDFFLVTARHRMWVSLLFALATARVRRLRSKRFPQYCFNRTVDRSDCEKAFRESREPLFAREALSLSVLRGENLYARLLESAPWMETLFPDLYRARVNKARAAPEAVPRGRRTYAGILNGAALLLLGPYLWLVGLVRNVRLRKAGRDTECFRTVVRIDRYATESILYDQLCDAYRQAFA